jgi:hypothetical protein
VAPGPPGSAKQSGRKPLQSIMQLDDSLDLGTSLRPRLFWSPRWLLCRRMTVSGPFRSLHSMQRPIYFAPKALSRLSWRTAAMATLSRTDLLACFRSHQYGVVATVCPNGSPQSALIGLATEVSMIGASDASYRNAYYLAVPNRRQRTNRPNLSYWRISPRWIRRSDFARGQLIVEFRVDRLCWWRGFQAKEE